MGYQRSKERNRRLKKLYEETKQEVGGGAYYDEDKKRYIRYSISDYGNSKYIRNIANRKVRHSDNVVSGGDYKKVYDYWWEMF